MILAIDPGTTESGYVLYDAINNKVSKCGTAPNEQIKHMIRGWGYNKLAIEMIASYGMPVGKETFETCLWIGRFIENAQADYELVYRKDVKIHLCGSMKAKDPNIRQALIDKLGIIGTKNNQGPLYGIKSHAWSALAVAITSLKL